MGRSEKSGLFFIGWGVGLLRLGAHFFWPAALLLIDVCPELKHYSAHENSPRDRRCIDSVAIQHQNGLFRRKTMGRNPQPAFPADDKWG